MIFTHCIYHARFAHLFAVNLDIGDIVLKHRGYVDFRKLVFTEDDKQTGFTARSISYNHQLLANRCHSYKRHTHTQLNTAALHSQSSFQHLHGYNVGILHFSMSRPAKYNL